MADKIKQIADAMDMLAEDTSVPRNIRKGATDAKARLLDTKDAMDVRCAGAINILDDLANDPNILYLILSLAEAEPVLNAFRIIKGEVEIIKLKIED